ncbi:hypothetical protein ZWY2020_014227 [Hordeum vulgare]|nr:hypothetical protein ZWY2020_014227 [Hordeum vulgare]
MASGLVVEAAPTRGQPVHNTLPTRGLDGSTTNGGSTDDALRHSVSEKRPSCGLLDIPKDAKTDNDQHRVQRGRRGAVSGKQADGPRLFVVPPGGQASSEPSADSAVSAGAETCYEAQDKEAATTVSGFEGSISPSLADLTSLLHVNLSHNSFSGGLLPELVHSGSIVLDASFNRLNGLLPELSYLFTTERPLQVHDISSNQFGSEFPTATWKVMKNLITLNASNNSFTGHIPSSLCIGLTSLALLDLY